MHNTESKRCNLLIVANFPSDTGYAWNTICEYFLSIGIMISSKNQKTIIIFPELNDIPNLFINSPVQILKFDFFKKPILTVIRFIKKHDVRILYLTDKPFYSIRYLFARLAGVKKIVVHDRTSGERKTASRIKRLFKKIINYHPFFSIDLALAVSDYVANRLSNVSCIPSERVVRIYNAIDIERFHPGYDDLIYRKFSIPLDKRVIFSHARANSYKGIQTLIEAAHTVIHYKCIKDVVFVFCGDGPDLEKFRKLVLELKLNGFFFCPGHCSDIERMIRGATAVVVPSIWQEAFGLSVLEGMSSGKPVIATRVGGIVEIIEGNINGFLFDPKDSAALSNILENLLNDKSLREVIGRNARISVINKWNIKNRKKELNEVFNKYILNYFSTFLSCN